MPRGQFPYALVIETKVCPDGLVRLATVRTSDGLVRQRDIRKLIPLELTNESEDILMFPNARMRT